MTISARILTLLAGLLILESCHFKGENGRIVGTLGSEPITVSDLRESAAFIGITDLAKGNPSLWSEPIRKAILTETLHDALFLDFVRERRITLPGKLKEKLSRDPQTRKLDQRRLLLMEAIRRIAPKQLADDREVNRYYQRHIHDYSEPEKAIVRHIVVSDRNEGEAILKALENGSSFSALARAKSLGTEAPEGGLMAPFAKGQLPPPFDAVFDLSPGDVSDLLPSAYGYHLFKMMRTIPPSVTPLSQVRKSIEKILVTRKRRQMLVEWIRSQEQKKPWKPSHHYRKIFPAEME